MNFTRKNRKTTTNSTFAIGGVSCSADSFVVAESFVLRINISGKNPAHRKSANRYMQFLMKQISAIILTFFLATLKPRPRQVFSCKRSAQASPADCKP